MPLNESKGNMYPFVDYTFNTIKGACSHDCHYCYMKRYGTQRPVRLDTREFKQIIGHGHRIFVGSSCDMFAMDIPGEWITATMNYLRIWNNHYFMQSKNPHRMQGFVDDMPLDLKLGTTIESNRIYKEMGNAPTPVQRAAGIRMMSLYFPIYITVEPIMEFDTTEFIGLLAAPVPDFIVIGADSGKHGLIEPTSTKISELIRRLEHMGIKVILKSNIKRLLNQK